MDENKFLENFESKSAKLLVILAFVGIAISVKPVYECLDYDTEKKLELYEKWINVSGSQPDTVFLAAIRKHVEIELTKPETKLEYGLSMLARNASYAPCNTFIYKFLAGGFLFLAIYGLQVVFNLTRKYADLIESGRFRKSVLPETRKILGRNGRIGWIGLSLGLTNLAFPMVSAAVNYLFIPCVLTLFCAISLVLWQESEKKEIVERIKQIK